MRHFTRIAESVDTAPLLAELDAAPEMWLADTSRQRSRRPRRAAYRAGMVLELRQSSRLLALTRSSNRKTGALSRLGKT